MESESSGSIPARQLQGRDLLAAAKEGYVFDASADGQMTLRKKETCIILRVRPSDVDSFEMQEIAKIFHLRPGLSAYKIKSELSEEDEERHGARLRMKATSFTWTCDPSCRS